MIETWTQWWLANYRHGTYDSTSGEGALASDFISALEACGVPVPTGRKIAAIVYEDELPEVTEREEDSSDWIYEAGTHPLDREKRYFGASPDRLRAQAASILSIARHIDDKAAALVAEARDAAAKERERAEEEAVAALIDALPLSGVVKDDYARLIARSAYELGARAPQGEEVGR